jgi:uncharacterized protein DUF1524
MGHGSYDVLGRRWALALVALLLLLTGCELTSTSAAGPHPHRHHERAKAHVTHRARHSSKAPATPQRVELPPNAAAAEAELDRLVVRPRPQGTEGYVRAGFGSSWVDTDHDGCNQRDDVLLRDAVPGTTTVGHQGACDHDVLAGTWHDPYTGRLLTFTDLKDLHQAEAIQIDHIVPLAEAWVSGARHWSRDRREAFANDLHELLAVDGPTNMGKGDDDPAAWRPRKGYQCAYARRWIGVKGRYGLAVDPPEKAALEEMLGYCR